MALTEAPPQLEPRVAAPARPSTKVPYLPGLDGLRALAVLAVLFYHGGVSWMRGGFLGVDVFFVISGYLITLLLVSEHQRTGRIGLKKFWMRRARRLLPALYALLITVTAVCVIWVREDLDKLRGQLIAAITYSTNWYLIATGTSYFDHLGRPAILQHLWSLAVEEQFYLAWPILLAVLMTVCRRRVDLLAACFAGMVLASTIWMAVLYDAADPSRAYYGTDTRAAALVLGALLALFWRPGHLARGRIGERGPTVDLVGVVGLGVLLLLNMNAPATGAFLYYGGFLLVGLATVTVIAAAAHPRSVLAKGLGVRPMRYVGTRSYGIYLWHWPVFVLTRPGIDVPWSLGTTLVVRFAITFALAEVSYRVVERPFRQGVVRRWLTGFRRASPAEREHRLRVAYGMAFTMLLLVVPLAVAVGAAKPKPSAVVASLKAGQAALSSQSTLVPADPSTTAAPATTAPPASDPASTAAPTTAPATTTPPTTIPPQPIRAIAVGDSVMLGAAPQLKAALGADSYVDAKVGRQFKDAVTMVEWLRDNHKLGQIVVLHLGNNGTVGDSTVEEMFQALKDVPQVIVVNVRVTQPWQDSVNATLAAHAANHPNVKLIDWLNLSAPHPDYFYSDATHLRPPGAEFYAAVITQALGG